MILFLGAAGTSARVGLVETKDGRTLQGQIRLSTNGVTLINATNEALTTIAPTNLAELFFDPSSMPIPDPLDPRTEIKMPVWQHRTIGRTNSYSWSEQSSGLVRIRSTEANIAGHSDAFHFAFRACTGNCEIVARIVSLEAPALPKAGLTIRQSLAPDAANVFVGVTGRRGGVLQHRDATAGETFLEAQPSMFVPYWLRLKRIGNEFTASSSANGTHWVRSQTITIPMPEAAYIGLAVATGGQQPSVSALFDNVRQDVYVPHTSFIPEVHLQSGSVMAGPILSGDAQRFEVESFPFAAPASSVSHILFRWLPNRYVSQVGFGRPGVLLNTGEFIEGEFSRLERHVLTMSSVLYGFKSFDTDTDVLAVVLRRTYEPPKRYTLATLNGTVIHPKNIEFGDYELTFTENSLGARKITLPELLWLRCSP
jgi:hypothetical protein